ncbi:hypothetical protein [Caulobacter sp. Root487D2Y]|uniref:hypothetical protein n=1 Tax=Caulobacter sp. Root487D2Y TaxID=1736547 RepID=UPI000A519351|nr:hypothetical protein [Caulobacter sp. Root487D2Y]
MSFEIFLNDLSTPDGAIALEPACEHLRSLVSVIRELRKLSSDVILNSDIELNAISIGETYSIAALRNASMCVEEGQFLKRLQDRSPFDKVVELLGAPDQSMVEYRIATGEHEFAGKEAKAFGLSYLLDGLGVSFASHPFWFATSIPLNRIELDSDTGEISEAIVSAKNVAQSSDVVTFAEFLRASAIPAFSDGSELWARREEIFPYLRFIPRVRAQIEQLKFGDRVLVSAAKRLSDINDDVGAWSSSSAGVPTWKFFVRPESGTRINKGLVNFNDEQGEVQTFSDHADFGPAEGRIHFKLQTEPFRHALIGHVGRKLGIG